jgi:hypothetical protein
MPQCCRIPAPSTMYCLLLLLRSVLRHTMPNYSFAVMQPPCCWHFPQQQAALERICASLVAVASLS